MEKICIMLLVWFIAFVIYQIFVSIFIRGCNDFLNFPIYKSIKKYNKKLNKKNLKKMNLRILLKAMSLMFLPTMAVLFVLLVGFFDINAMWVWIKSNSGGAIFARIAMLLAEICLVTYLYFYYLEEEKEKIKAEALNGKERKDATHHDFSTSLGRIFTGFGGYGTDPTKFTYTAWSTPSSDVVIIERTKKKEN